MKPPSIALLRAFSPWSRTNTLPFPGCLALQDQHRAFSTSPSLQKRRGKGGPKPDPRIRLIRYHLQHGKTPRPLRFSRNRYLRHWTIHRAWQLHQRHLRETRELELGRQYDSMRDACEALRLIDNHGLTAEDRVKLGEPPEEGKEMGRLYRIAMLKNGVWDGVPIEYARLQTDSPGREPWNHEWTR